MVPVLETERLRLRGHTPGDLDASAAMWADESVVRFIGGTPSTREECWRRILLYAGHWHTLGFGYWLIEDKGSGEFLGEGGFADFQRGLPPPFDAPEQGWALAPAAQGKGVATEAVRAMIAWAEPHFQRSDFVCMIKPENTPSLRVAEKTGYTEYLRTYYKGAPTVLLQRP